MQRDFRNLPSVDRLISDERLLSLAKAYSRSLVLDAARQLLEEGRLSIARGDAAPNFDALVDSIRARARSMAEPSLVPVINATGVLLSLRGRPS